MQSLPTNSLEVLLQHDRRIVIAALGFIVTASWLYIFSGAGMEMPASEMSKPMTTMMSPMTWTSGNAVIMFFMWWIMMLAMMLPSAAPMILLHAKVLRRNQNRAGLNKDKLEKLLFPTMTFTFGYILAWGLFSIIATALQWYCEDIGILSPMLMRSSTTLFAGFILVFAGIYQLTPLKQACLKKCRGPIQYLTRNWRSGSLGAMKMGLHHGTYCLGCCWGLMAMLFFGGIMNLYWIIGLAIIVLMEKLLPVGTILSKIIGGVLLIWGSNLLFHVTV